ncbi:hypothetical protein Dimus_019714 [Dionaea muscipula]
MVHGCIKVAGFLDVYIPRRTAAQVVSMGLHFVWAACLFDDVIGDVIRLIGLFSLGLEDCRVCMSLVEALLYKPPQAQN